MRYSKCRLQLQLIDNIQMFPVKYFERLKKIVYHTFRESILPYLPDSAFTKCFDSSIGRPTKDIKSILGLFLLQVMLDLTDIETVEAFSLATPSVMLLIFQEMNTFQKGPTTIIAQGSSAKAENCSNPSCAT